MHSQAFRVVASLSIYTHCYPGIHCILRQWVSLWGDNLSYVAMSVLPLPGIITILYLLTRQAIENNNRLVNLI